MRRVKAAAEAPTPPAPVDQYVDVKGVTTRYWIAGSTGSPVVLIHGLGGYVDYWLTCLHALASEHRVFALDVMGHGKTNKPSRSSYGVAALAQFRYFHP